MRLPGYEETSQLTRLTTIIGELYHQASVQLGISDSIAVILHEIHDHGDECLLSDIYKNTGVSKQTINSSIRGLEAEGILYLEQHTGRAKKVVLTEKGKNYMENTIVRLCKAEVQALRTWTLEEVQTYIGMIERFMGCLREEFEKL